MSNKRQIDRIHKIISVALQGDTEYIKHKLETKFNLQTSQEYWFHMITVLITMHFPSRRKHQWRVISRNVHTVKQIRNYLINVGRNVKIKAQVCLPSGAAYNC